MIKTSYYSKTSLSFFYSFKTVYTGVKSVQEPSIMEKYPILQISRTAGFKIDWYIPSRKLSASCPGKGDFALLLLTSFEKLVVFLLYLFTPVSDRDEWFSNLDTKDPLEFQDKLDSWLLCTRKFKLLKINKTHSVINITKAHTQIFPEAATKKRNYLPTKAMYSSVQCVILKDKPRALIILRETWFEFVFLG